MDQQRGDGIEDYPNEHESMLEYVRKAVYQKQMTEDEAKDFLIDYWISCTGEVMPDDPKSNEAEMFDPVYAFATWTDKELLEKKDEYEQFLQKSLTPNWRQEIERQVELINLELAYRKATH